MKRRIGWRRRPKIPGGRARRGQSSLGYLSIPKVGGKNRTLLATAAAFMTLVMLGAVVSTWQAIRLSREGSIAVAHKTRAEHAEQAANERLFRSSIAQARAVRLTGRIGQRLKACTVLEQATSVTRAIELAESVTRELRDETIACLASRFKNGGPVAD